MFYRLFRWLFLALAAALFRFRVEGADHLPIEGPAVIVAAHRSWLDPVCLGGACRRPIRFLILGSVYDRPWSRWFYRGMRAIRVVPGGSASLGGTRRALRGLAAGELIGVFPEGRVFSSGRPGPVHRGAALLCVRAGVPLIPVEIHGSARAWPQGKRYPVSSPVRVRIRAPLLPSGESTRSSVRAMERRLESLMRELDAATR